MIRDATVADDPDLLACIVELQEAERAIDPRLPPGQAIAARYLEHIRDRGRDWQGHLLVADVDGVVAGFVTVFMRVSFDEPDDPPGAYALVNDLVVRAAYRGRGLGRRLLAQAEGRAVEAGAVEVRWNPGTSRAPFRRSRRPEISPRCRSRRPTSPMRGRGRSWCTIGTSRCCASTAIATGRRR